MELSRQQSPAGLSERQAAFLQQPHCANGSMRGWLESTLRDLEDGPDSIAAIAAEQLAEIDGQAELAGLTTEDVLAVTGFVATHPVREPYY